MKKVSINNAAYMIIGLFYLIVNSYTMNGTYKDISTPEDVVAIATSITGKSVVVVSGKEKELTIGQELIKGAIIKVSSGKVNIVFMNGDFIEVGNAEELTLGSDAASSTITTAGTQRGLGANDVTSVSGTSINVSESVQRLSQLAQISSVRGEAKAIAVSPRLVISVSRPTFLWFDNDSTARGKTRNYTLIIHDSNDKEIYRSVVRGKVFEMNSFALPKNQKAMKPISGQRYSWSIFEKGKVVKSKRTLDATFSFTDSVGMLESKSYIQQLDNLLKSKKIDLSSYNMMLGLHFADEHQRLFADAIPYFHELSKSNPNQSYPFEQLAFICNKFGNEVSVAAQHFATRARSINQK